MGKKQVLIFSALLVYMPGDEDSTAKQSNEAIDAFRIQVNQALYDHPEASIQWLQSSAASRLDSFTQVTAIVEYVE